MSLCSCYYVPTMLLWCDVHTRDIKHSTWGIFLVCVTFPLCRYVVMSQVWTRLKNQYSSINFFGGFIEGISIVNFCVRFLHCCFWLRGKLVEYPRLLIISPPSLNNFWNFSRCAKCKSPLHGPRATMSTERTNFRLIKPGSHLRHNDITERSRKPKNTSCWMFYVSSVNITS